MGYSEYTEFVPPWSDTNSVYAHRDKVLQTIKAPRDDCSRITSHLSQKQASRYAKWAFKTKKQLQIIKYKGNTVSLVIHN